MKTRIFAAIMLMISFVTFAQPSRRGDSERRDRNNSDRNNSSRQSERKGNSESHGRNFSADNHRAYQNGIDNQRNSRHNEVTASVRRIPEKDYDRNRHGYEHNSCRNDHVAVYTSHSFRRPIVFERNHRHFETVEVRRARFPYRIPVRGEIIWSNSMYRDYRIFYPEIHYWRYPIGHRVVIVSAYDARDYFGEVANVYGKVADTYYNYDTDEYFLYFGDSFPNHDFSAVISGNEARKFSRNPENFFLNEHISITGYVNNIDGKPEVQIRSSQQISLY